MTVTPYLYSVRMLTTAKTFKITFLHTWCFGLLLKWTP